MTTKSDQLTILIDEDLALNSENLKWHGQPIEKCRTKPVLLDFYDSCNENSLIRLWLVFEEDPVLKNGYKVIYSDEDEMFGLAVAGKSADVFIGLYGSFVEALNSM